MSFTTLPTSSLIAWGLALGCAACTTATGAADGATPMVTNTCLDPATARVMLIEDVFSISGRGTVVTGRIENGSVRVGDRIFIVAGAATLSATVTGVEMFRKVVEVARAGDNVGLLLRGVTRGEVARGQPVYLVDPREALCRGQPASTG